VLSRSSCKPEVAPTASDNSGRGSAFPSQSAGKLRFIRDPRRLAVRAVGQAACHGRRGSMLPRRPPGVRRRGRGIRSRGTPSTTARPRVVVGDVASRRRYPTSGRLSDAITARALLVRAVAEEQSPLRTAHRPLHARPHATSGLSCGRTAPIALRCTASTPNTRFPTHSAT
jgi:hypothetical protein